MNRDQQRPVRVRRARELALGICAAWLVLQNGILLATVPMREWIAIGLVPALTLLIGVLAIGVLWLLPILVLMGGQRVEERHDR